MNYFVIYYRDCVGHSVPMCVVENEEVAKQFCEDFGSRYYYLSRGGLWNGTKS